MDPEDELLRFHRRRDLKYLESHPKLAILSSIGKAFFVKVYQYGGYQRRVNS